jgi:two-component system, chemotaxis family, response regulator Rcp1
MSLYHRTRPAEILLVEDSPADIRLVTEALKGCSIPHHLTAIDNGQEALKFLHREAPYVTAPQPDLVVLDLNLPGLNGRELLTTIRQEPALQHLVVVVLTSSASPQDAYALYQIPVNCFVTKPFDIERFFLVIRTLTEFWLGMATIPEDLT